MSDQDFDTRLLDLFYGELPPDEARALEAEIAGDTGAKETLAGWSAVRSAVKDLPVPEPDPQVHYTLLRAAREAVAPAEPKGFWAFLSKLAVSPIFAGVAVLSLAVGAVFFMQSESDESGTRFADIAEPQAPNAPVTESPDETVKQDAPARIAPRTTARLHDPSADKNGAKERAVQREQNGEVITPAPKQALGLDVAAPGVVDDHRRRAPAKSAKKREPPKAPPLKRQRRSRAKTAKKAKVATKARKTEARKTEARKTAAVDRTRAAKATAPDEKKKGAAVATKPRVADAFDDAKDAPGRDVNQPETARRFAPPPPAAEPTEGIAKNKRPEAQSDPPKAEKEMEEAARFGGRGGARTDGKPDQLEAAAAPVVAAPDSEADDVAVSPPADGVDQDLVAVGATGGAAEAGDAIAGNGATDGVAADDDISANVEAVPQPVAEAVPQPVAETVAGTRTTRAAAPARRAAGRVAVDSQPNRGDGASAVPSDLQTARAARLRGDHQTAVGAYARYFERHRGHNQFSRSLFEAAASYEALGDVSKALRMYGLIPSSAGNWYVRAQARIGALRAVRNAPPPRAPANAVGDDGDESNRVEPMPMPPKVDPPRR